MGNNRPVKTTCFLKYLASKKCIEKRTKGSHTQFKCGSCWQSITVRKADKEIPALHIKTNCQTLGVTIEDFYKWAADNC
ncbi:type II toxin-antitoxin system HicA family toxin [Fluviicola taffensis]|uniref:YcfA family protein n=1 Tax=Fluviicola taffensis (strain DSM 16823 / NCIMB 13979 / RW262) TaxID=755732 RepID=F2I924_FLUTR|nr:hypothetical protein [Fluviicola taffensis]AEA42971.1 hypothetical protein Fluta_0970 [Fluviicola taffensis DSM 16823]